MGWVDIFIPLAIGLFMLSSPAVLVKDSVPDFHKKRATLKKCGIGLLVVAGIYAIIKFAA